MANQVLFNACTPLVYPLLLILHHFIDLFAIRESILNLSMKRGPFRLEGFFVSSPERR